MAESQNGTNEQTRRYGAVVSQTETNLVSVDPNEDGTLFGNALDAVNPRGVLQANARVRVVGRKADGTILMETQHTSDAFNLNEIQWSISANSIQESTTVDVNGDAITVDYPDSLDWAAAFGGTIAFQYTQYEEQTCEAQVYKPAQEITGTVYKKVARGTVVDAMTALQTYQNTINNNTFFGHKKGNVLCLGVDWDQQGKLDDGSWVVLQRFRFLTRPGSQNSMWGEGAGGWNTWHYWTDPVSGMIPDDVSTVAGALVEAQHYPLKSFASLLRT